MKKKDINKLKTAVLTDLKKDPRHGRVAAETGYPNIGRRQAGMTDVTSLTFSPFVGVGISLPRWNREREGEE